MRIGVDKAVHSRFTKALEQYRESNGLKWNELAHLMGVNRTTVYRWMKGMDRLAEFKLQEICIALGIPVAPLLNGPRACASVRLRHTYSRMQQCLAQYQQNLDPFALGVRLEIAEEMALLSARYAQYYELRTELMISSEGEHIRLQLQGEHMETPYALIFIPGPTCVLYEMHYVDYDGARRRLRHGEFHHRALREMVAWLQKLNRNAKRQQYSHHPERLREEFLKFATTHGSRN